MLFLQFLNVPKRCLRMRPDAIVSMQQHLLLVEVHARERRRIAPSKRQLEAEFFRIEVDRGSNVGDGEAGVDLLAFDEGSGRCVHGHLLSCWSSAPDGAPSLGLVSSVSS